MKLAFLLSALVAVLLAVPAASLARTHATPTPSPSPPIADPAITQIARQQFVQWQAGVVNKSLYAAPVLPQLTDEKINNTSTQLAKLGALTSMVYVGRWINPDFAPGTNGYIYQMRCVEGNVYLWLALDAQGKLATVLFKNRFDVENVTPTPSGTPAGPTQRGRAAP
ncbi:MAG: hypothetical protein WBE79_15390 [Candidatus Cybelea sp.]